jgi:hypothetical protein
VILGCFTIWMVLFGLYFPEPFPVTTGWSCLDRLKWILVVPLAAVVLLKTIVGMGALENYAAVFPLQRFLSSIHNFTDALSLGAVGVMFLSLAANSALRSRPMRGGDCEYCSPDQRSALARCSY